MPAAVAAAATAAGGGGCTCLEAGGGWDDVVRYAGGEGLLKCHVEPVNQASTPGNSCLHAGGLWVGLGLPVQVTEVLLAHPRERVRLKPHITGPGNVKPPPDEPILEDRPPVPIDIKAHFALGLVLDNQLAGVGDKPLADKVGEEAPRKAKVDSSELTDRALVQSVHRPVESPGLILHSPLLDGGLILNVGLGDDGSARAPCMHDSRLGSSSSPRGGSSTEQARSLHDSFEWLWGLYVVIWWCGVGGGYWLCRLWCGLMLRPENAWNGFRVEVRTRLRKTAECL